MTKAKDGEVDDVKDEQEDEVKDEGGKGGGSGATDTSDLEGRIRTVVREVVEPLLEHGRGTGGRRTALDDEDEIFRRVKAAQDKIKAQEEQEGRFVAVEETLKKVTEKPPARNDLLGKVQRWFWGEVE